MGACLSLRPVDPNWSCHRSGDCCRSIDVVLMTEAEQATLMAFAQRSFTIGVLNTLNFLPSKTLGFVELIAKPCPLLSTDAQGRPTCTVHEVRPFNCRRFGCLRPNPKTEPLVLAPLSPFVQFGNVGCVNVRERLVQSRVARRVYGLLQRKAQRWGRAHGWVG